MSENQEKSKVEDREIKLQVENNLASNSQLVPQQFSKVAFPSTEMNSLGQRSIRVQLRWDNINVIPKDQAKNSSVVPKKILDNVCGTVMPKQFLAIIGASGAGKTTLLNYLSNKMFPNDLTASGTTTINGINRDEIDYFKFTAFVQQDDILFEALTVNGKFSP